MKINKLLSYFLGLICLSLPVIVYKLHIKWLGFPDGSLTDIERVEKTLYQVLIWPAFALGLFFIYLGWMALKQDINKKLVVTFFMFILYLVVTIIADGYLRSYFGMV